jgi:hypothetical protein
MNPKIVWSLIALSCGGIAYAKPGDAPAVAASSSNTLRERYVEGLTLIAEFKAAQARAEEVLTLVDEGASEQVQRIREMESRLSAIKFENTQLDRDAKRAVQGGKLLIDSRDRLQERFDFLDRVLGDQRTLLKGATSTVSALLEAADKSGRLVERRLAEQSAEELKSAAGLLNQAADRLGRMRLRVDLESTLINGLQPQAKALSEGVADVASKREEVAAHVTKQRIAAEQLTTLLDGNRSRLDARGEAFAREIEAFRLVQVEVLRRWLLDGPPAGDMPALSIDDVIEAGGYSKKPKRPGPSSTVLGADGMSGGMSAGLSARGDIANEDRVSAEELNQAGADVIALYRKARWYLAMLERLNVFAAESLETVYEWTGDAESWRSQFTRSGRTLADQRGVLSSLEMEQSVVTTTVGLITKQAKTAEAQVDVVVELLEKQTKRLAAVTAELKRGVAK